MSRSIKVFGILLGLLIFSEFIILFILNLFKIHFDQTIEDLVTGLLSLVVTFVFYTFIFKKTNSQK